MRLNICSIASKLIDCIGSLCLALPLRLCVRLWPYGKWGWGLEDGVGGICCVNSSSSASASSSSATPSHRSTAQLTVGTTLYFMTLGGGKARH